MEEIIQQINNNNKRVYKDDIDNIDLALPDFSLDATSHLILSNLSYLKNSFNY